MGIFDRIGRVVSGARAPAAGKAAAIAAPPVTTHEDPSLAALEVPDLRAIVCVEEVRDARFFVNGLFRRRFGSDAPDYPRHFVAFHADAPMRFTPLGYIHYSPFEDSWLCGGMVMDDRAYRRLPAHHRAAIRAAGGVAEIMLRDTFARLRDAPAIWGYVGDKLAEAVDRRVGFIDTGARHVMVVWNRELPDADKAERLAKVVALGPF
jgi:hypothetical protein